MTQSCYWPSDGVKFGTELTQFQSLLKLTSFKGERILNELHQILDQLDELKERAAQSAARLRTGTH